jgi:hypothetical protein
LLELSFSDHQKLKESGRNFDCSTCDQKVKNLRRCQEDREDFTFEQDKGPWPIYVNQGGELYSFCPAKATWDHAVVNIFRLLVLSSETGALIEKGGLNDQPSWFIEHLSWFAPKYHEYKFNSRANKILGSFSKGDKSNGGNRRSTHTNKR